MATMTSQDNDDVSTNPPPAPVLTVYRGWKDPGRHVWSPFVVKLEARLRFGGVAYRTAAGSPKTAPRGKIPYVELGTDSSASSGAGDDELGGDKLGDSGLIIEALTERGLLPDLNARLDGETRARDLGVRSLMEDRLCFYHGWERWTQNYYTMRDHIFGALPYPLRVVIGLLAYRGTVATLHGQGTGRYSGEEIAAFRREVWEGVDALLRASRDKARAARDTRDEGKPFWILGGEGPTEADATVFGFVVSVLICTAGPDSQKVVKGLPVILEYAERIQDRYFPDYEKWTL
ncbi:uncharacterized protein PG986_011522 [Apiospora aurea]|uniref:Thioredoxin-like fold domain-containing protein n=1 Tax=Apiospora aurea TaxID=335848 RepID=A0ABR1PXD1_9PEZI